MDYGPLKILQARGQEEEERPETSPPKVKFQPHPTISFGSLTAEVDPGASRTVFGSVSSSSSPAFSKPPAPSSPRHTNGQPRNQEPFPAGPSQPLSLNSIPWLLDRASAPFCSRCFGLGHDRWSCQSRVRCARCFDLGHIKKRCTNRARTILAWRPKLQSPKLSSTQAHPKITWRPKIPLQSNLEIFSERKPGATAECLDPVLTSRTLIRNKIIPGSLLPRVSRPHLLLHKKAPSKAPTLQCLSTETKPWQISP